VIWFSDQYVTEGGKRRPRVNMIIIMIFGPLAFPWSLFLRRALQRRAYVVSSTPPRHVATYILFSSFLRFTPQLDERKENTRAKNKSFLKPIFMLKIIIPTVQNLQTSTVFKRQHYHIDWQ
jgi:hypothetical protein